MSYYKILGFDREPFSTSPDPEFFYQSKEHMAVLYRLHIAINLKRGLSLILGEVGTGKTTLMRKLINTLSSDPDIITKIILDPTANSEKGFLALLSDAFGLNVKNKSIPNYKKAIESYLLDEGLMKDKTILLFIDEAQKLSDFSMEVLRILLNYETNDSKLIQIVLLGQQELLSPISSIRNLWDRITLKYVIHPLEESELKELISFRLRQAGYVSPCPIFTDDAIKAICEHTKGYLRKTTLLCHDALEYLVMYKKEMVDRNVIEDLINQEVKPVFDNSMNYYKGMQKIS